VDAFLDRSVEVFICPALVAELTDVLGREKFAAHAARAARRRRSADDDYLLALAQAHGLDAVVSGDRHLLDAGSSELQVLTPRELVDRLGLAPAG